MSPQARSEDLGRKHQFHGVQPVLPVGDVLASADPPEEVRPSGELRIHVGHDLDGLFAAYRDLGVEVVFAPVSQPWGLREFAERDRSK